MTGKHPRKRFKASKRHPCDFVGAGTRFVFHSENDANMGNNSEELKVKVIGDMYVRGIGFDVNSTTWEDEDRQRFVIFFFLKNANTFTAA